MCRLLGVIVAVIIVDVRSVTEFVMVGDITRLLVVVRLMLKVSLCHVLSFRCVISFFLTLLGPSICLYFCKELTTCLINSLHY